MFFLIAQINKSTEETIKQDVVARLNPINYFK